MNTPDWYGSVGLFNPLPSPWQRAVTRLRRLRAGVSRTIAIRRRRRPARTSRLDRPTRMDVRLPLAPE